MGIKKIARPINKAKNQFVKWLKDNNATSLDVYEGDNGDSSWDYYRTVSAFIGENLYVVDFHIWEGRLSINYADNENNYKKMDIKEFLDLIQ